MPDTRAHDEVYCPDCGLQWVASQGVHRRGCQHLDLFKRPTEMDDDELLLALWLADGGVRRLAPSEPDWSAEDYSAVRGVLGRLVDDCQSQFVALASAPAPRSSDRHDPDRGAGERLRHLRDVRGPDAGDDRRDQAAALAHVAEGGSGDRRQPAGRRRRVRHRKQVRQARVPPGRPGPLSVGAGVGPSGSRPEPEPTRPEPEPPPQPTKPPEPEPPKPEAISEETLGKVEQLGYRLGRGIAIVLLVAVVTLPVAVVWWLTARS